MTMLCVTCVLAVSGWLRAWGAAHPASSTASTLAPGPDDAARRLAQVERMYGLREQGPWLSYVRTLGSEVSVTTQFPPLASSLNYY